MTEVTEKARMMAKKDSMLVKAGAVDSKLIERHTVVSTTLEAVVIPLGERAKASSHGAAMELEYCSLTENLTAVTCRLRNRHAM